MKRIKLEIIKQRLTDENWLVRQAAVVACVGREIPLDVIREWLASANGFIRQAALEVVR